MGVNVVHDERDEKARWSSCPSVASYIFTGGDRKGQNCSPTRWWPSRRHGKLVWYYQMVHHDLWDTICRSAAADYG